MTVTSRPLMILKRTEPLQQASIIIITIIKIIVIIIIIII